MASWRPEGSPHLPPASAPLPRTSPDPEGASSVSIELLGITPLGNKSDRLDFRDGGAEVSFVLEQSRRRGSTMISREFGRHFYGRTSAWDAVEALGRFIEGEQVDFPVQVRLDGFTGLGR